MVSLPNSSEKGVKGMLSRKQRLNGRRFSVFEIGIAIQTSCVSLPNLSEKDVKGLLSRKQPLHTSPTTGAKAVELSPAFLRANVCELSHTFLRAMRASPHLHPKGEAGAVLLSSLGNLTSPPRLCPRVESQTDCSKPERSEELALAKLLAIHYV